MLWQAGPTGRVVWLTDGIGLVRGRAGLPVEGGPEAIDPWVAAMSANLTTDGGSDRVVDGSDATSGGGAGGMGTLGSSLEALFVSPEVGGRQATYPVGAVLCEPGHAATDVFFVHKGQVRLFQVGEDGGEAMLVEILGPGQWFGVAAVAGRAVYGVKAVAVAPSVVTRAGAAGLMRHICATPDGARAMIRELAGRHCDSMDEAGKLVFDDCNSRLVKTLLRFSGTAAASKRDAADGGGVVLRMTHQQLAQAVGVARETVSLALTNLRKQNMLKTGRNQLFFDPEVLKKFQGRADGVKG